MFMILILWITLLCNNNESLAQYVLLNLLCKGAVNCTVSVPSLEHFDQEHLEF